MKQVISQSFLLLRKSGSSFFEHFELDSAPISDSQWVANQSSNPEFPCVVLAPFEGKAQQYKVLRRSVMDYASVLRNSFSFPEFEDDLVSTPLEKHREWVQQSIRAIHSGELKKVVISRVELLPLMPKSGEWLVNLAEQYPHAHVFLFQTPKSGAWLGATPETLLSVEGDQVRAMSLAGTRIRGQTTAWGEKEIEEQELVTREITDVFESFGMLDLHVTPPKTHAAGNIEHLCSWLSANLPEGKGALQFAGQLHPTPAVGGLPVRAAKDHIHKTEAHNRKYYCGYFGFSDDRESLFMVNLRSMQLFKNRVALYAGGGITAQSVPELEWQETERKFDTLKSIIQQA